MQSLKCPRFWAQSLAAGLTAAAVLAAAMATLAWFGNPGGIFHDATGTNWPFVLETAWSWFAPTTVLAVLIAAVARLAWLALRRARSSRGA